MLSFYLRSAFRSIGRKKLFSGLNIAGLAIGICVFLLTLEYHSYETGFNRWDPQLKQLFRVNITSGKGVSPSTAPALAPLIEAQVPGVRHAIRFADNFNDGAIVSWQPVAGGALKSFREDGCVFVDAAFPAALHLPVDRGHTELQKVNTVVITRRVAQKLFGAQEALGETLHLHNQFGDLSATVIGVTADLPAQSDIRFDYLFSIQVLNDATYTFGSDWARLDNWGNASYTTYVDLAAGVDPVGVAQAATLLWQHQDPDYKASDGRITLQPVGEIHLGNSLKDPNPTYGSMAMTLFILGLGILILCIAWINYVNFSTAEALSRAREIGIHKIIGSQRRQIVLRYITESFLLNLLGLLIAFALINITQGLFNYITGKPLTFQYINQFSTWVFIAGILCGGVLVCGTYVGLLLSKFKVISILQFNDKGNMGNLLLRKGLVVFQLCISSIFIMSTLVVYRQIRFMKTQDLGMNIDHLVVINGPALKDSSYKTHAALFKNELSRLPFVQQLSCTGSTPGMGGGHNYNTDGVTGASPQKGDELTNYYISEIDDHYFSTYHIPLVSGLDFSAQDVALGRKSGRLIVNETAARALGYDPAHAAGRVLNWNGVYTIEAVVKDYHHLSLKEAIEPILYVPSRNNNRYTIRIAEDAFPAKMDQIKDLYERLYPGNGFEYVLLSEAYDRLYTDEQRAGVIAMSLSVLVITISGLGLIGLSNFTARRRLKEMGIRRVLGASVFSLFSRLSGEFLWLVGIALLIAVPLAWLGMSKWLEAFAYRTTIGWWIVAVTGSLSLLITFFSVGFQAIRTAFVNPVRQLRNE
jgi:putative ABC transport system permease protein